MYISSGLCKYTNVCWTESLRGNERMWEPDNFFLRVESCRLSSDWSFFLKLCSDWLVNLLKEEFQKWGQTNGQTN